MVERECPFCAEVIKPKAIYCKHCHNHLPEQNQNVEAPNLPDNCEAEASRIRLGEVHENHKERSAGRDMNSMMEEVQSEANPPHMFDDEITLHEPSPAERDMSGVWVLAFFPLPIAALYYLGVIGHFWLSLLGAACLGLGFLIAFCLFGAAIQRDWNGFRGMAAIAVSALLAGTLSCTTASHIPANPVTQSGQQAGTAGTQSNAQESQQAEVAGKVEGTDQPGQIPQRFQGRWLMEKNSLLPSPTCANPDQVTTIDSNSIDYLGGAIVFDVLDFVPNGSGGGSAKVQVRGYTITGSKSLSVSNDGQTLTMVDDGDTRTMTRCP